MVRVAVSVEGITEERFIRRLLLPEWNERNIYASISRLNGNVQIRRIAREIEKLAYSFDYVTTLYDYYGFRKKPPDMTKSGLEESIKALVPPSVRNRVFPYIQMHEFEGLLFSSPEALASCLQDKTLANWATEVLTNANGNPEAIDDSPETAPSRRLLEHSQYRKTIHGPMIAERIGLGEIRTKCPGFDAWLAMIESWAG